MLQHFEKLHTLKSFSREKPVFGQLDFSVSLYFTTAKLFCSLMFTPFSNMANNIHLCLQICDLFIFFQVKRINMFCNHVVLRRRQVILYNINEFFSQSNEALQPELNYSRIYLQNMKIECFSKEHKQFLVHSFSYFFSWIL